MRSGTGWIVMGAAGVVLAATGAVMLDGADKRVDLAAAGADRMAAEAQAPTGFDQDVCRVVETAVLPGDVAETSGLARGIRRPDVFWTHNDSGNEAEIFGVDASGALVARVRIEGASIVDWEDIEAAPCDQGSCLYIADTGDNDADRESVLVYVVPEPDAGATSVAANAWQARYPDRPADAESLFIVNGELYLVTKGRHGPVRLYRLPRDGGQPATLQLVAELGPQPSAGERIGAATASPDGRWIVMRTPSLLRFYPAERLLAGDTGGAITWDASSLGHPQGEAVAIDDAGNVWLTSEAEQNGRPAFAHLSCSLP
ncbi:MAG TPA: hypothetical protein VFU06_12205 [Longimicrobiales bacterium]|nr:hypothetical protein [Longimicrobiales bacterium]